VAAVHPTRACAKLWAIVGRRGGKSRIAALIAVFIAIFIKYKLAAGERGMVLVLAASMEQARVVFGYALAFLKESPVLRKEIVDTTSSEIRLRSGVVIAVHANSFRSVRGRTLLACVFDEVSSGRDDTTATPDNETYTAVLPSLATTNGMLVGTVHRTVRPVCFTPSINSILASTATMFSSFKAAARRSTHHSPMRQFPRRSSPTQRRQRSEWDAEFRADLVGFLDDATIDRGVDRSRPLELAPRPHPAFYRAFVDPSGGAIGGDAYSICIAHKETSGSSLMSSVAAPVRSTREKSPRSMPRFARNSASAPLSAICTVISGSSRPGAIAT